MSPRDKKVGVFGKTRYADFFHLGIASLER
jgi:hypothetical protein